MTTLLQAIARFAGALLGKGAGQGLPFGLSRCVIVFARFCALFFRKGSNALQALLSMCTEDVQSVCTAYIGSLEWVLVV